MYAEKRGLPPPRAAMLTYGAFDWNLKPSDDELPAEYQSTLEEVLKGPCLTGLPHEYVLPFPDSLDEIDY